MEYAAIILAILGLAVGLAFRLKVLLPILALLLVGSGAFAIARGLDFGDTALVVFAAQAAIQFGYFVGIVAMVRPSMLKPGDRQACRC
jgi:hypothetical protein